MAKPSKAYTTKPRNDLTAEFVREILSYDPETGIFTWNWRTDCTKVWNKRRANKIAGWTGKVHPYILIGINKNIYLAHRLAWLYMTGKWPANRVDHFDKNKSNNRWNNLRNATCWQNSGNAKTPSSNKSGFRGVFKINKKWRAVIIVKKVVYHLGYFGTAKAASEAYNAASIKLRQEFSGVSEHHEPALVTTPNLFIEVGSNCRSYRYLLTFGAPAWLALSTNVL